MDFFSLLTGAFDDSTLSVIALLAGMFGGYWINGRFEQLKAKRAKVDSRSIQRK
ncbi:MAG: hypothetical protein QOI59_2490 [Gammaproteobacteria bacterium]|nr:hypothetical protein [Gammaproteobacteria bacterium]